MQNQSKIQLSYTNAVSDLNPAFVYETTCLI